MGSTDRPDWLKKKKLFPLLATPGLALVFSHSLPSLPNPKICFPDSPIRKKKIKNWSLLYRIYFGVLGKTENTATIEVLFEGHSCATQESHHTMPRWDWSSELPLREAGGEWDCPMEMHGKYNPILFSSCEYSTMGESTFSSELPPQASLPIQGDENLLPFAQCGDQPEHSGERVRKIWRFLNDTDTTSILRLLDCITGKVCFPWKSMKND